MSDPSSRVTDPPPVAMRRAVRPCGRPARGLGWLALAAALLLAGPAAAQVRVRFAPSLGLTDAQDQIRPDVRIRGTLTELARILEDLGRSHLRPGETLDLTVLGLRLTGISPFGYDGVARPRIATGATPPRIRLAYVLRREGRVVAQGRDDVTDLNYLVTQNPRFSSGPLYYEQRILRDWFDDRFRYGRG